MQERMSCFISSAQVHVVGTALNLPTGMRPFILLSKLLPQAGREMTAMHGGFGSEGEGARGTPNGSS